MTNQLVLRLLGSLLGLLIGMAGLAQPVPPHPDNSPPMENFYKMGVPSVDSLWTLEEFEKVLKLLRKISGIDKYSLPRQASPYSGQLFAHLTNKEHMDELIDTTLDIRLRIGRLQPSLDLVSSLLNLYVEYSGEEERFGAEFIECYYLIIHFTNNAVLLMREFEAKIGPEAKNKGVQETINAVQDMHADTVLGLLDILGEYRDRFDEGLRNQLAQRLTVLLPQYWVQLVGKDQRALLQNIEALQELPLSTTEATSIRTLKVELSK